MQRRERAQEAVERVNRDLSRTLIDLRQTQAEREVLEGMQAELDSVLEDVTAAVDDIARRHFRGRGDERLPLLTGEEVRMLKIGRGSLDDAGRVLRDRHPRFRAGG